VALKVALKVDLKVALMVVFNRVQKQVFASSCQNNYMNPSYMLFELIFKNNTLNMTLKVIFEVTLKVILNLSFKNCVPQEFNYVGQL
jgi:hypothetical protein